MTARLHWLAAGVAVLGMLAPESGWAQPEPLAVKSVGWPADRFIPNRTELLVWLSRPLETSERVGVVVGRLDLSALVERTGDLLSYRPHPIRLPAGESEVTVYLIDSAGAWSAIGRHPIKVLGRAGLERSKAVPLADLSSNGQLDRSVLAPAPGRNTYQDVTARLGVEYAGSTRNLAVSARINLQGVSHESQRLRFGTLGVDAPAVDLTDYQVKAAVGPAELSMGNVSIGANRHLLNGFGSRGFQAGVRLAPALRLDLGLVNGSNVVGWSNLTGVTDADHRIGLASLGLQLIPSRPGAIQVDVTAMDGSIRPIAGFTQQAATDAETSRGVGITVVASDVRQRIRLAGGYSRSRFSNPADPLLFGDTTVVAVRPETREARFGELTVRLLDNARLTKSVAVGLGLTGRHERVDPLYRSVGAWVAADQEQNGLELVGQIGAVSLQGAATSARDNLGAIASILTTRTRGTTWSASAPLASLVGAKPAAWWPAVTFAWQRTRQFGDGLPIGGDFQASHVPDQVSVNRTGGATWTVGAGTVGYRWNRSTQDNRQIGRERADFRTEVNGLSVSAPAGRALALGLDLALERNRSFELGLTQEVERLGLNAQWQLSSRSALSGAMSHMWSVDPRSDQRQRNLELFAELSQGFNLYRRPEGGTQGRFFVRYGRTRFASASLAAGDPFVPTLAWTVTAGSSFRAF